MAKPEWWGTGKDGRTRQEVAAEPEPFDAEEYRVDEPFSVTVKRPPGRKDTRAWCKGKVGREHRPVIAVPPNAGRRECGWRVFSVIHPERIETWRYQCRHVEMCSVCGKVLRGEPFWRWRGVSSRHITPQDCPEFAPLVRG